MRRFILWLLFTDSYFWRRDRTPVHELRGAMSTDALAER